MHNRFLMAILAQTIATALAAPMIAGTQASGAKKAGSAHMAIRKSDASPNAAANATDKKTWKLSYTADGQPDLQGIWTNLSFTPLVRPAKLAPRIRLQRRTLRACPILRSERL
jgi:hypothetical protein